MQMESMFSFKLWIIELIWSLRIPLILGIGLLLLWLFKIWYKNR